MYYKVNNFFELLKKTGLYNSHSGSKQGGKVKITILPFGYLVLMRYFLVICSLLLWMSSITLAQRKYISGLVKDAHSEEPLPFAGIQFVGTNIGTTTGIDGKYYFELKSIPSDSLLVSVIGYERIKVAVNPRRDTQTINFSLNRTGYNLKEFVVSAGVNPALILLKKIIRHKPVNNFDKLSNYKYEAYNKLEVDINKLNKDKLIDKKLLKPFAFIFETYIDTLSEEKPFLPILLTETISDYYYRKSPKKTREIIKAYKTSGIKNESVTKFLGAMYQNVNIYNNFIPVFDKQFVSPINNLGSLYYDYKIVDTQFIYNRRCIHVTFFPKRYGENTFVGDFWVHDSSYAIQKMNLQVEKDANINFVEKLSLIQEFRPVNDSTWFLAKDKFVANFYPGTKRTIGFIGRKTTTYDKVVLEDSSVEQVLENPDFKEDVKILTGAKNRGDTYWKDARHEALSKNEKAVYEMIDTLHKMPIFKHYTNAIEFIASGIKKFGPIEVGPYFYLFSSNRIERFRMRMDLATTPEFDKKIRLKGYLAYGFGDREFKGRASVLWLLNRTPRMYLYGSFTHDFDPSSAFSESISSDNIFALAIQKAGVRRKFVLTDEIKGEFFKEWYNGFSQSVALLHKRFSPYEPLPAADLFPKNGNNFDPLTDMEATFTLRYAYREKFLEGDFKRFSLGSKYPIVSIKYTIGIPGVMRSNYEYHKLGLNISDYIKIPPFGSFSYNLFGGKIYGTLPFPLLEVHPGNDLYYYSKHSFNMMNRYEFLSDQYAGFNLEHVIGSGIFNYLPLVRRLKLRQLWTAKGVIGSLSPENRAMNFQGTYAFKTLEGNPYVELGTGVENIFRLIRIDFIWRVAPQPLPTEPYEKRFGIFGSLRLQF